MSSLSQTWKRVPDKPRRIVTFIVGMVLIIFSALIGWLPGPGGMVPFLLGIAVLATEFVWAERLRDKILQLLKDGGAYIRKRPYFGIFLVIGAALIACLFAYILYTKII